jgi:hypothetical protein
MKTETRLTALTTNKNESAKVRSERRKARSFIKANMRAIAPFAPRFALRAQIARMNLDSPAEGE